jgi:hypothetical protein
MSSGQLIFKEADKIAHHFDAAGNHSLYAYYYIDYNYPDPDYEKIHDKVMKELRKLFRSIVFRPLDTKLDTNRRRIFCFRNKADEAHFLFWAINKNRENYNV